MTKIKNFRISLRPREVARWLKNNAGIPTTPEIEASVDQALKGSKEFLKTASIFTTLSKIIAAKAIPLQLSKPATAVSFIIVSVGSLFNEQRDAALQRQEPEKAALFLAMQEEALHQTLQFTFKLIQDQAKEEECEVSAMSVVGDTSLLPPLAALLGIGRIGLDYDANAFSLPPHARMVWSEWTPIARSSSKRGANPAKTSQTAAAVAG